jgi:hypothetical protein
MLQYATFITYSWNVCFSFFTQHQNKNGELIDAMRIRILLIWNVVEKWSRIFSLRSALHFTLTGRHSTLRTKTYNYCWWQIFSKTVFVSWMGVSYLHTVGSVLTPSATQLSTTVVPNFYFRVSHVSLLVSFN